MPTESLQKLVELAKQGATLLFLDRYPEDVPGLKRVAERKAFTRLLRHLPAPSDFAKVERHKMGRGVVLTGACMDELCRAAEIHPEPFKRELGGTMLRRKNEWGGHNYFLSMLRDEPVDGWVELAVQAASAVIFDPMSGRTGEVEIRQNDRAADPLRYAGCDLVPGRAESGDGRLGGV